MFINEMYNLVGDEYKLLTKYNKSNIKVKIKHNIFKFDISVNDIFVIISFASQSAYFYTDGKEVVFARMAGVASFCITAITTYITISIILAEVYKVSYLPIFYPGEKTYWNSRKEKKNEH